MYGGDREEQGSRGSGAGMCAFIHAVDFEHLCRETDNGETPFAPVERPGSTKSVKTERRKGTSEREEAEAQMEPGLAPTPTTAPGQTPAPCSSDKGLPAHLRCMLPPKEDTNAGQLHSLESLVKRI